MKLTPKQKDGLPWRVGTFRSSGNHWTIWIEDRMGVVIVPWLAFDDSFFTAREFIARAKLIVRAVNALGDPT